MTREYNTHLLDALPESAGDTLIPCAIEDGLVYLDVLNLVRFIVFEANDLDGTDEPNDADAVTILNRIEWLLEHSPVEDGWASIGHVERTPGGDKWLEVTDLVVSIEWPPQHLSAAGYRYSRFPLYRLAPGEPIPFGHRARE